MELGKSDYQLFDRPIYAFKQLKESHPTDKIEQIKKEYKEHWQKWKEIQLQTAALLPDMYGMSKPKIESWTNACLAVLLNQKQYQIYLMYQHYKSEERYGSIAAYNQLLAILKEWSKTVDIKDYYIWPQPEHELDDHLALSDYLSDTKKQEELKKAMRDRTFQMGKLFFYPQEIEHVEQITAETLQELAPLYQKLGAEKFQ